MALSTSLCISTIERDGRGGSLTYEAVELRTLPMASSLSMYAVRKAMRLHGEASRMSRRSVTNGEPFTTSTI